MSGPSIHFTVPDRSLFKFPPDNLPPALPPPSDEATWKSPFPIDFDVFNGALDFKVPLTIATTYVVTVFFVNAYNRRQGNKPWWISTTRAFKVAVVLHNVFLAVYSAVTFYAMCRAINAVWPGLDNSAGLAGVADSLCKINGPRGLGDAVYYNATSNIWQTKNAIITLMPEGTPDPTDVGRLWNEGLAFWGWFFYLSKFYEVVDTAIIVAKGKRSATLQTYHHAGAMLCMWAGIRYMSPPIWMFVFINSFIHALMYTYFTLSAINIRVPNTLKRTLTTMQITQFLFGASYAAIHLFVKYDIPVATAYSIFHPISSVAAKASATASSVISAETYGAILRRILLRAAGDEGVAENVRDKQGNIIMDEAREAVQKYHEETRYRTDYTTINCLDTTGQSFAVWLNILYLFPLTVLFVRFFVRAYLFRSGSNKSRTKRHSASRATKEAAHGTNREIEHAGKAVEKKLSKLPEELEAAERRIEKQLGHLPKDLKDIEKKLEKKLGTASKNFEDMVKKDLQALKEGRLPGSNKTVSEGVESVERKITPNKKDSQQIKEDAAENLDELKQRVKQEPTGNTEFAKDNAPESPSAAASPSKKQKKRKNKKNKNKQAQNGADNVDDHTDAADSGSDHEHTEPENYAAALKEDLHEGETQDLKSETDEN
ncbi:hypothetical protein AUEXF2481DRAFT_37146 [Aureobasidium subglaciale EXF-2481]|uniref:Elongation of fatty acids protein n=1 Tax=Aureobasidium subglaciale (strain EXF-2481) TaxID=1043005 RepID=A0A074YLH1_AURSE|nr:uncharacterized protein AUEXF2481DRAFT_37146 [Aureobasidium subglaciale EXF-2481]KAI5198825.1 hypothetical protein E4T38_07265 [Aureobasidium subglaciale]KAI5217632.1 hypothetical protein E4T40_07276 [Aureobasidium subglaciale]KAI5221179.1 hypothetical protein E4T41_07117 [Aureobasidium subglaciale]KAI5258904.1 hypothetical protein E4T46_07094 [Aureobasidium subglaciale]KEQ98623.1 hypothetical protein AUEXF2481DRAFT_37146 [Aureobasidium subglaciale EXF-2481]